MAAPGRHRARRDRRDHLSALCVALWLLAGTAAVIHDPPVAQPSAAADVRPALQPEPTPSRSYRPVVRKPHRATRTAAPTRTTPAPRRQHVFAAVPVLNADRWDVLDYARAQVGKPYAWGGEGPGAFDCSGLVLAAFARAGYAMPRFSGSQHRMGNPAPLSSLSPGDLVAWPGHVALYLGRGMIVEAARPGTLVRIRALGGSWFDAQAWGVSLDYSRLPRR